VGILAIVESTTPIDVTLGAFMQRARLAWSAVIIIAGLLSAPVPGTAATSKDARRIYEEATAAFGLGRYAEAAEKYEAAFGIRPDPALLYNAAQAYRLAGNKARAIELYRNYVRLYPDGTNAEDARSHAAALKTALEAERPPMQAARPPSATPTAPPVATAPPPTSAPPPAQTMPPPVATPMPTAPLPAAPPPPSSEPNVPMVSRPASAGDEQKPLTSQTWFWVAVGAAVVVLGTTVVLFATRGEKYPDATLGSVPVN
jgi:tetratricopeptide repeat protein